MMFRPTRPLLRVLRNMLPKFQMYENVDRQQAAVSIKTKSCIWHGDW